MALFMAVSGVAVATVTQNSVKQQHIAKGAVTTPKLANGAVTSAKLRNGAVLSNKIAPAAVGPDQIGSGAVGSAALAGGSVLSGKIRNSAVVETKIANGAVTANKLAANAVTTGKIADGAIGNAKIAPSLLAQLLKNVVYVTAATTPDNDDNIAKTAECPAGKQAIGGGAKTVAGTATVPLVITGSSPAPVNASGKHTGWTASSVKLDPDNLDPDGTHGIEVFAVCADL